MVDIIYARVCKEQGRHNSLVLHIVPYSTLDKTDLTLPGPVFRSQDFPRAIMFLPEDTLLLICFQLIGPGGH